MRVKTPINGFIEWTEDTNDYDMQFSRGNMLVWAWCGKSMPRCRMAELKTNIYVCQLYT